MVGQTTETTLASTTSSPHERTFTRHGLACMRRRYNCSAFDLITDASRRIPDKTGSNDYFPMISTGYKDSFADKKTSPPLCGREVLFLNVLI